MYKKVFSLIVYVIVLINIFSIFVLAQEQPLPPPPQSQPTSVSDVVTKVMQIAKKDIIEDVNRNMDENFMTLDGRLISNNKVLTRKMIFSLTGSLAVVIFGYAYITNRVNKRYDINFYEKMMDSKIEKLARISNYVISEPTSFYASVTHPQFDEKYKSPKKYFEKITDSEEVNRLRLQVNQLRTELEKKGVKIEGGDRFYSSVFDAGKKVKLSSSPASFTSFFDKFRKEPTRLEDVKSIPKKYIIGAIIVVILIVYLLVSGFTDFSILNFFTNSTGGAP